MVNNNTSIVVTIDSLAFGGNGVCRVDGKVCFVPFACPGDVLEIKVVTDKRAFMVGEIISAVTPSTLRCKPFCPVFGKCGGCNWQHVSYALQLTAKRDIVLNAFIRSAKLANVNVSETLAAPHVNGYRHRGQFKVGIYNGKLQIGFYRLASHEIVDIPDGCPVMHRDINSALVELRSILAGRQDLLQRIFQVDIHAGINGVTVVLHTKGNRHKSLENTVKSVFSGLKAVSVLCLKTEHDDELLEVFGAGDISYEMPSHGADLHGYRLEYNPAGFAQINQLQNIALLQFVFSMANLKGNERILDLYCGNGNFSIPLSGIARFVLGIEGSPVSIAAAMRNSQTNAVTNISFECSDVLKYVKQLVSKRERFDLILLDPPRAGAAGVVSHMCQLSPDRIIYISCDPTTLARDSKEIVAGGYQISQCIPVDMFPHTFHVESITLFTKGNK